MPSTTLHVLTALSSVLAQADASSPIKGVIGVLFGVGALIFFHEAGHFLAAKWAGVRVEVFSLGFGHRLIGFKRGDTDYRISLLPLGGYVRMLGQADEDPFQPATDRDDDFRNKSPGKRFVILVAGVVMNLVLAAVGFIGAFGLGVEFAAPEVGRIAPGSAAARADLRPGDLVLSIEDSQVLGWQDLQTLVALSQDELSLQVLRDGEVLTVKATPSRGEDDTYARLGVTPALVIGEFTEGSALEAAGALTATPQQSDRVLNIAPIESKADPELPSLVMKPRDLIRGIDAAQGLHVVTVERTTYDGPGRPVSTEVLLLEVEVARKPEYTVGLDLPDRAYVRSVRKDSAAEAAGVKPGDRLASVGGQEVRASTLNEVVHEAGAVHGFAAIPIVVERFDGQQAKLLELEVTLELENGETLQAALDGVSDEQEQLEVRREVGRWLLGVSYGADVVGADSTIQLADPDAEPITIPSGSRMVTAWLEGGLFWSQDVEFLLLRNFGEFLRGRRDEPFKIAWLPPGADPDSEPETAVVKAVEDTQRSYGDLGYLNTFRKVTVQRGPLDAISLGLQQTIIQTSRIFLMLRSFVTGAVSPRELGGPIQIVNVAYTVARQDSLARLLHLLAILSVNLAVINILPIPVLDGGHIMFLLLEKLKGRPVSSDVMAWAQYAGLFMILGLMVLVFFNDIRRVF
jgi:regulator of sigma E protease